MQEPGIEHHNELFIPDGNIYFKVNKQFFITSTYQWTQKKIRMADMLINY